MSKTFYITTPIYYANSLPHLGHLYTTIVADVIHRYKKQRGFDVYFLTGTDEHGINIQRAAEKNGRTPKEQVDLISGELKRMFHDFGLDPENGGYDVFMRTTEPFHYEGVQHLWREIAKSKTPKGNDNIYKGFYEGWFCAPCAEFKTEGEYSEKISQEYIEEIGELIDFLDEDEADNEEKVNRLLALGLYETQFYWTREQFAELEKQLPRRLVYDYNRDFDYKAIQPFFDTLISVIKELKETGDSLTAASFEYVSGLFSEARKKGEFSIKSCLIHERPLDKVAEESYFFRLSDYDEWLIDTIENTSGLVRPDARKNEVLSFVRSGLQDLSISRQKSSVSWGVPVPDDENHVMYVWLDALSNYITALSYGNDLRQSAESVEDQQVRQPVVPSGFEKYWPAMHLVGKDILRFHTVYWFSFLKAAGLDLPKTVFAHGMWLDVDGRKMGKTLGNVIEVDVLHQHFSVDAIRYFLLREMVFGQDGKFGYENLIERANADLASGLGNLASRTFSMITKYREGAIPDGKIAEENYIHARRAGLDPDGGEIVSVLEHARDEFLRRFDNFEFSLGLEVLWTVIARIDKMISDCKPWVLIKDEKQAETLNAVLYRATETLRWLTLLLYPVMPAAAKNIYAQIGLGDYIERLDPAALKWGELEPGTKIGETEGVFPRIDKNKVMSEINEQSAVSNQRSETGAIGAEPPASAVGTTADIQTTPPANAGGSASASSENFITIDDFIKVELRVGEIKVAERIPNADKLLRFEIDLGEEKPRQILAGLAEYYDPEKLIGRKVVVVANLKPRKMRGLESQGMICAASLTEEDSPAIATFLEDVKIGARLK